MALAWETVAHLPDGRAVDAVTLDNGRLRARVMTYGAILLELHAPDRHGHFADVLLGFDDPAGYFGEHPYFNAVVGRYANRIAGGRFSLDGKDYVLATNNGPNHLHGGLRGFDKALWRPAGERDGPTPEVVFHYRSPAGDEGYPGKLDVQVTYRLTDDVLELDYAAATDAPTIVNLTHHAYFNLAGQGDILDHELQLFAPHFLPVDASLIPTGELRPVTGTAMDFLQPARIGDRLDPADPQLALANGGYDHTWVLERGGPAGLPGLLLAARLADPASGRVMEVWTTEPGLQFYSGNFLDGSLAGKGGVAYEKHAGLCLEAHHFPDSPNRPGFPPVVLRPGALYRQTTRYRFPAA